jgi:hypothetical protein
MFGLSTFVFVLAWQFSYFVLLTQLAALCVTAADRQHPPPRARPAATCKMRRTMARRTALAYARGPHAHAQGGRWIGRGR